MGVESPNTLLAAAADAAPMRAFDLNCTVHNQFNSSCETAAVVAAAGGAAPGSVIVTAGSLSSGQSLDATCISSGVHWPTALSSVSNLVPFGGTSGGGQFPDPLQEQFCHWNLNDSFFKFGMPSKLLQYPSRSSQPIFSKWWEIWKVSQEMGGFLKLRCVQFLWAFCFVSYTMMCCYPFLLQKVDSQEVDSPRACYNSTWIWQLWLGWWKEIMTEEGTLVFNLLC